MAAARTAIPTGPIVTALVGDQKPDGQFGVHPDGAWQAGGRWWRPPGSAGTNVEVVDWSAVARASR